MENERTADMLKYLLSMPSHTVTLQHPAACSAGPSAAAAGAAAAAATSSTSSSFNPTASWCECDVALRALPQSDTSLQRGILLERLHMLCAVGVIPRAIRAREIEAQSRCRSAQECLPLTLALKQAKANPLSCSLLSSFVLLVLLKWQLAQSHSASHHVLERPSQDPLLKVCEPVFQDILKHIYYVPALSDSDLHSFFRLAHSLLSESEMEVSARLRALLLQLWQHRTLSNIWAPLIHFMLDVQLNVAIHAMADVMQLQQQLPNPAAAAACAQRMALALCVENHDSHTLLRRIITYTWVAPVSRTQRLPDTATAQRTVQLRASEFRAADAATDGLNQSAAAAAAPAATAAAAMFAHPSVESASETDPPSFSTFWRLLSCIAAARSTFLAHVLPSFASVASDSALMSCLRAIWRHCPPEYTDDPAFVTAVQILQAVHQRQRDVLLAFLRTYHISSQQHQQQLIRHHLSTSFQPPQVPNVLGHKRNSNEACGEDVSAKRTRCDYQPPDFPQRFGIRFWEHDGQHYQQMQQQQQQQQQQQAVVARRVPSQYAHDQISIRMLQAQRGGSAEKHTTTPPFAALSGHSAPAAVAGSSKFSVYLDFFRYVAQQIEVMEGGNAAALLPLRPRIAEARERLKQTIADPTIPLDDGIVKLANYLKPHFVEGFQRFRAQQHQHQQHQQQHKHQQAAMQAHKHTHPPHQSSAHVQSHLQNAALATFHHLSSRSSDAAAASQFYPSPASTAASSATTEWFQMVMSLCGQPNCSWSPADAYRLHEYMAHVHFPHRLWVDFCQRHRASNVLPPAPLSILDVLGDTNVVPQLPRTNAPAPVGRTARVAAAGAAAAAAAAVTVSSAPEPPTSTWVLLAGMTPSIFCFALYQLSLHGCVLQPCDATSLLRALVSNGRSECLAQWLGTPGTNSMQFGEAAAQRLIPVDQLIEVYVGSIAASQPSAAAAAATVHVNVQVPSPEIRTVLYDGVHALGPRLISELVAHMPRVVADICAQYILPEEFHNLCNRGF